MLISVITVCYNSEKTIRRTFDAMLTQSNSDYEYIVIDGQSADHTVDIIREYEPKFQGRMRWISEPDNGIYDAMNKGVKMSQGELIGIINSDDYYHKDALSIVQKYVQEYPDFDVYHGILANIDCLGNCIDVRRTSSKNMGFDTLEHEAAFIRKSAYMKVKEYRGDLFPIAADYDLFLRLYLNKCRFMPMDHIIVYFSLTGVSSRCLLRANYEHQQVRKANSQITNFGLLIRYPWILCFAIWKRSFEILRTIGTIKN